MSRLELIGIFEGPTSVNGSTSIRVVETAELGDAQRSSRP